MTPKLVARAAYGIFYGGFENIGGAPDPGYDYPWAVNLSFSAPNGNILPLSSRVASTRLWRTDSRQRIRTRPARTLTPKDYSWSAIDRPWKTSYIQEWNGSVQYQFSPSQSITLGYIGNNSHHLLNGDKRNLPGLILPPGTTVTPYLPFPDFGQDSDYLAAPGLHTTSLFKSPTSAGSSTVSAPLWTTPVLSARVITKIFWASRRVSSIERLR